MKRQTPWRIRAIQLDLARQRETIPAIGEFIRFAKAWGYNTLVLYLEGVVRTKSFPYRAKNQSYSLDDMRRIVEMAGDAGLEVVPCVSTLGHVEHFTACRPLHHLCEDSRHAPRMFCPSNPKVYEFLERYLAELAPLFPSGHFHIGCDEADELGFCPACRKKSRESLLLTHIHRVREIMAGHGKRVWIWDDMFENASLTKLAELSRDIVLCPWNYRAELMDYDGLQGHFNNLDRRDWLTIYEKLGFDVLICPSAQEIENTLAFTEIARRHCVLGGLQTNWEMSTTFLPSVLPGTALAGALWSQPKRDPQQVLAATLRRMFPSLDATARAAVHAALIRPLWTPAAPPQYHLRGRFTEEEARQLPQQIIGERILNASMRKLSRGMERDILEELLVQTRLQIIAGRLRQALPQLIDPRLESSSRRVDECALRLKSLADVRARQWRRYRPGIRPDRASILLRNRSEELGGLRQAAKRVNVLVQARLFLWAIRTRCPS